MKQKIQLFYCLLLMIGVGFTACKGKKNRHDDKYNDDNKPFNVLTFDTLKYEPLDGMNITRFVVDTNNTRRGSWGVMVRLSFDFQDSTSFEKLRQRGFDGYLVDMYVVPEGKPAGQQFNDLLKEKFLKSFLKEGNREVKYISEATAFKYKHKYAFREFGLPAGRHNLLFKIAFLPVKFKPDEQLSKFVRIAKLGKTPDFVFDGGFKCTTPPLKKVRVRVADIEFDKKKGKAGESDFTLLKIGSGYPDLYWKVFVGRDPVFRSQRDKNSLRYKGDHTSKPFYCTEKDRLTFAVYDHDISIFNRDDLLLRKRGKLRDFSQEIGHADVLSSRKIKTAKVAIEVLK
ncbi:hypothetical protein [uncultured Microscilla sp.]|uniref:hypothetical protein n=1 Tax=uncultured Microscilla sp. TaxID=432653 RepID=UPI002608FD4F|nr:hypothetical protein [uncultured Microscilla sp.]